MSYLDDLTAAGEASGVPFARRLDDDRIGREAVAVLAGDDLRLDQQTPTDFYVTGGEVLVHVVAPVSRKTADPYAEVQALADAFLAALLPTYPDWVLTRRSRFEAADGPRGLAVCRLSLIPQDLIISLT